MTPQEIAKENPHLMLEDHHLKKMSLKELPAVGSKMHMHVKAHVSGHSEHETPQGKKRMLHLEITHMKMVHGEGHEETDGETKGKKLYGEEKEK